MELKRQGRVGRSLGLSVMVTVLITIAVLLAGVLVISVLIGGEHVGMDSARLGVMIILPAAALVSSLLFMGLFDAGKWKGALLGLGAVGFIVLMISLAVFGQLPGKVLPSLLLMAGGSGAALLLVNSKRNKSKFTVGK